MLIIHNENLHISIICQNVIKTDLFCCTLWPSDRTPEGSNQLTEDFILTGFQCIYCLNAFKKPCKYILNLDMTAVKEEKNKMGI